MDRSLLEHLRIDRNYFPRSINLLELLQETSGYVPSIEKIVNRAFSKIDKQFIQEKGYQWIDLSGPWIGENCKIHIFRRSLFNVPSSVKGQADLGSASVNGEGQIQNMEVHFYIDEDRKIDDSDFKITLHHELTHAYEYLQRSKRIGDLWDKEGSSKKIEKIQDSSVRHDILAKIGKERTNSTGFQKTLLRNIYTCLYMCSPLEQNAFIAQIKAELETKADSLSNFRKAAEAIEQTAAWHNLQTAKKTLNWLQNLEQEKNRIQVVRWSHAFFGNCKTFNQAIKRISYELDRFERKLKNRLGKMCGEIYQNSDEYRERFRAFKEQPNPF